MAEIKEMEKLPEGWELLKIGEILIENPKSSFKVEDANNSGKFPFFTSGDNILTHSNYVVDGENLFLSTGGTAYVNYYKGKAAYSADTYSIKSKIDPKYLYYFLLRKIAFVSFRYFIGSGLEHLQKNDFKNSFEIFFPKAFREQCKIAEILETVDNAIEKTDRIIEKYKRIKQGLMQDLLTKGIDENGQIRNEETHRFKDSPLGRIPEEWEVVRLEDVSDIKGGKRLPKGEEFSDFKTSFPYIRLVDIKNMTVELRNLKFLKPNTRQQLQRYTVSSKDVIISIAGTVGLVALIPQELDGANLTENAAKITSIQNFVRKYLAYYLSFFKAQEQIEILMGIVAQPKLALFRIKQIQIPHPSLPEQHRIASILSQIDETIEKEKRYKEKLERIKQGLMEDLLTGKVRVNHLIEGVENVSQT